MENPDHTPSNAEVFVVTRKHKPGRKYQTNPDVMNFRVEAIEERLKSGKGLDGIDELVSAGEKFHGPGWLIGRHDTNAVKKAANNASGDSYMQELKKKIRQELVVKVEEKLNWRLDEEVDAKVNRKVQDNLTLVLKKLGKENPDLKIDLTDICATISSDMAEVDTPLTCGRST